MKGYNIEQSINVPIQQFTDNITRLVTRLLRLIPTYPIMSLKVYSFLKVILSP